MVLCGISSHFWLLSPCTGQVTHALLTRPPLNHQIFSSEENQIRCFVRLACVKHAASVHPEPGSNSHVKVCIAQKLAWLIILFDYCCFVRNELNRVLVSFLSNVLVRKIIFIIFQGCFTVQLSRFFAVICDSFYILSKAFLFVKNFFIFFKIYFKKYSERAGIRTPDNLIKSQVLYHLS